MNPDARQQVTDKARACGWVVTSYSRSVTLRKDGVAVAVRFSSAGDIVFATWQHRALSGKNKLQQVLKSLES